MFRALMSTGFTIGILYILFGAPYLLAKGLYMIKNGECYKSDKLKCAIPIYNLYVAEKLYDNRLPVISISALLTLVTFIARIYMMILMPNNIIASMVVLILFIVFLLIFWISSAILVHSLISSTSSVYGLKKVVCVVLFPLGEFYVGNYLAIAVRNEMNAKEAI